MATAGQDAAALAAQLAYLRGVADLTAAGREIQAAAKATEEQELQQRLRRAGAYARTAALGAAAQKQVRDKILRARLAALKARADAIAARIDRAAAKTEQAARREVQRLNKGLAQAQKRIQQQLQRALRAGSRELKQALREIERELKKPIAVPLG